MCSNGYNRRYVQTPFFESAVLPGVALKAVRSHFEMCQRKGLFVLLVLGLTLSLDAGQARAQADYRNLDPGRPIAVEDAQPIAYRELEAQNGIPRFNREHRGQWIVGLESEYKMGIYKDLQVGLSSEYVVAHRNGNTVTTGRDRQLHLLYNFNQETRHLPALAIRPELTIRGGGLGSRHEHAALKAIASKTIGHNRLHLNGSYTVGPTAAPGRGGELVNRYFYGAAYERTFPLKFVVLLADVYARKPIDNAPTQVVFEVGTRVQLTPRWVLDTGISTGALRSSAGPDLGFTFGLSHSFSFRWLYPRKGTT